MNTTDVYEFQQSQSSRQSNIRRIFLISLIASLGVSALIAIFVFLLGDFGGTEIKLLLTTLTIGAYSLTGLSGSALYDKRKYIPLAFSGIIVSILGFLTTVVVIWEIVGFYYGFKLAMSFIILAFSIAHISSLFLFISHLDKKLVKKSLEITIGFIILVAVMLIFLVVIGFNIDGLFYRLLGVFAVLDVFGTIVTLVLKKANL